MYCYYTHADLARTRDKFHYSWGVDEKQKAIASDADGLVSELKERSVELFERQIIEELLANDTCLVKDGDLLVRKSAMQVAP